MLGVLVDDGLANTLRVSSGVLMGVAVLEGVSGHDVSSETDANTSVGWNSSSP